MKSLSYTFIFLFSVSPIYNLLIIDNYNDFLIINKYEAEAVTFYLTKSYSLINNFSFFFKESKIDTPINFYPDLFSNAILAISINLFGKYGALFLTIILTFFTYSLLYYLINLKLSSIKSLLIVTFIFFFHGIGPNAIVNIFKLLLQNGDYHGEIFRYYAPAFTDLFFLLYLISLNDAYDNKNYFKLYFFSVIIFLSYFFYSLFVIIANGLLSLILFKRKFKIFYLNFLSIAYIFLCYLTYLKLPNTFGSQGFNLNLFFNLNNFLSLKDFFLFFIIFFLRRKLNKKKDNIYCNKIIFIYSVCGILWLIEFFSHLQIFDHISRYFIRSYNWFVLFLILFRFNFFFSKKNNLILKKINIFFILIIFFLLGSFYINTFKFFNNNSKIIYHDTTHQINIIEDLEKINNFFIKKKIYLNTNIYL